MYNDLVGSEVTPQVLTIITATHRAREENEFALAEKSIGLPEGVINSLCQSLFPGMQHVCMYMHGVELTQVCCMPYVIHILCGAYRMLVNGTLVNLDDAHHIIIC